MSESTTSCVSSPLSLHHHRTARMHELARLLQLVSEHGGSARRASTPLGRLPQIELRFGECKEHNKGCNLARRSNGNFFCHFCSFQPPFGLCKVPATHYGLFLTRCKICTYCRFGSFNHIGAVFRASYSKSIDL